MPRYYFDIQDAKGSNRDDFGEELESIDEAREQCQGMLPDIVRDELPDGDLHIVTCEVRDETGRIVYRGRLTYQGTRLPEGET